ncbi:hypothetical protein NIES4071_70330 [Calothrix sp. NIES-4071]|nr:hypothetical protein NIES4071_70330 [Calothrix sp. NIES-4071]BAZ61308.1 hypothetical protein NIES4105_70280 [Calothrix sp. NIES-4105]
MNTFLSSLAVILSTLALICSGFAAYQVYTFQQTLSSKAVSNTTIATPSTPTSVPSPIETTVSSPQTTTPSSNTTTQNINRGEFVQPAFGNKGRVELLSVKRIKDPETGNRDVVDVQMRIRRIAGDNLVQNTDVITVSSTTARNPDTSETYKGVNVNRSTGAVSLSQLRPNSSADAYVWLRVPDGINNLDIFVPDTAAFKNVPIAN